MTHEEVDWLLREESRQTVLKYLDERPERLALRLGGGGALLATQLKYLQRARTKLPSYYRARCILPPLAFEQASSEAVAARKTVRRCALHRSDLRSGRRFGPFFEKFRPGDRRRTRSGYGPGRRREFFAAGDFEHRGGERLRRTFHRVVSRDGRSGVCGSGRGAAKGNRKVFRFEECSPDIVSLLPAIREKTRRSWSRRRRCSI